MSLSRLLDCLCSEQQQLWTKSRSATLAEEYFRQYPELLDAPEAAFTLIYNEYLLREANGERVDIQEYLDRFPTFSGRLKRQLAIRASIDDCDQTVWNTQNVRQLKTKSSDESKTRAEVKALQSTERFNLLREIGSGAMGTVYAAYDSLWQNEVALKVLDATDTASVFRLKKEFRSLAGITHRNLVKLYELFWVDDQKRCFFTMELVDGIDFLSYCAINQLANSSERDHVEKLEHLLSQLTDVLRVLHQNGTLHCDIKPSNVLVTREGRVVLLDFGLASEHRRIEELRASRPPAYLRGTVAYMSPEQLQGEPSTPASDYYAIGVMLYQVLSDGQLPFIGAVAQIIAAKQAEDAILPLREIGDSPETRHLAQLCKRLLDRDPAQRATDRDILKSIRADGSQITQSFSLTAEVSPVFVGREAELASLKGALAECTKYERPVGVLIDGQSGVGKTALVRHFIQSLEGLDKTLILSGRCHELENIPFRAIDGIIEELCSWLLKLPPSELRTVLPTDVSALLQMFPAFLRIPGIASRKVAADRSPKNLETWSQACDILSEILGCISRDIQIVMFIDDVHWGDLDSAKLFLELFSRDAVSQLLIIGTCHSNLLDTAQFVAATNNGAEVSIWSRRLHVNVLTPIEALRFAKMLLRGKTPTTDENIASRIEAADGNPFMIKVLAQLGPNIQSSALACDLGVEEILWRSIVELPLSAQALLRVIAVAGYPIDITSACRAACIESDSQEAVQVLRTLRLVFSHESNMVSSEAEPYHYRIRDCVLRHLSQEEIHTTHRRLADVLLEGAMPQFPAAARHFYMAGDFDRACSMARTAASRASGVLAFEEAVDLYKLAIETHRGSTEDLCSLRRQLAKSLADAKRDLEAADEYFGLHVTSNLGSSEKRQFKRLAADYYFLSGTYEKAFTLIYELLEEMDIHAPRSRLVAIIKALYLGVRAGQFEVDKLLRPTKDVSSNDMEILRVCWTLCSMGSFYEYLNAFQIFYIHRRFLCKAISTGEPRHLIFAFGQEAVLQAGTNTERGRIFLDYSREVERRSNDETLRHIPDLTAGALELLLGNWQAAKRLNLNAARSIGLSGTSPTDRFIKALSQFYFTWAQYCLGEYAAISETVPQLLRDARKRRSRFDALFFRLAYSNVAFLVDDDPELASKEIHSDEVQLGSATYSLVHLYKSLAVLNLRLYRKERANYGQVKTLLKAVKRSGILRVKLMQMQVRFLRAHCILLASAEVSRWKRLRIATHDARWIAKQEIKGAGAMAGLIQAHIAMLRGDVSVAAEHWRKAAEKFSSAEMIGYAHAAGWRYGMSLKNAVSKRLVDEALEFFDEQKVRNPLRFAAMLAPSIADDTPGGN